MTALFPDGLPVLETPRLRLRPFRAADAEDVFAYASDAETVRMVRFERHAALEDTKAFLRRMEESPDEAAWALERKAEGGVIGSLGVRDWEPASRCCEVGFVLNRGCWGRGFAAEALQAAVAELFQRRGVNRIQAHAMAGNLASGRVLARCGFEVEGLQRQRVFLKGTLHDVRLFALLKEDWLSQVPAASGP